MAGAPAFASCPRRKGEAEHLLGLPLSLLEEEGELLPVPPRGKTDGNREGLKKEGADL